MHFNSSFRAPKLCPPENIQAQINSRRIEGINVPFNFKVFGYPFDSGDLYHTISKVFKYFRFPSFIHFGEITSRYILSKSKMIGFIGVCRYYANQITKTIPVRELPEHHDKQLIPTSEMFHVFISFVFHNKSLKVFLRKKLYELSKYIFSTKHLYPFLVIGCKVSHSNRGHYILLVNSMFSNVYIQC